MEREHNIPLKVPDIGENDRIELIGWNVKIGDQVEIDDELCELVTEKAAFYLESPENGVITEIYKEPGSEVAIGETVALLQILSGSH